MGDVMRKLFCYVSTFAVTSGTLSKPVCDIMSDDGITDAMYVKTGECGTVRWFAAILEGSRKTSAFKI